MTTSKKELLTSALAITKKSAQYIQRESEKTQEVRFKGATDLVTQVDHGSERIILNELERLYPHHSVVTEESNGKTGESPYRWIIDPLDGTTNFVHGYPFYAVSVAVYLKEKPVVAVVVDVYHQQTFWATENGGAFLDGKPISVSRRTKLKRALLATGFPYLHDEVWARNFDHFKSFTDITQGIRRAGSAAIDLAHVACGLLDGFWEFGLKPWDQAAGVLLVREAGGQVSKTDGEAFSPFDPEIVASNGHLHDEMLKVLKEG